AGGTVPPTSTVPVFVAGGGGGGVVGASTPRWVSVRFMNSLRADSLMPSKPNPVNSVSSVATTPPSLNSSVRRSQPLVGFCVPAGGGPTVQPPRSVSKSLNSSVVAPSVSLTSSTQTPRPSVPQSVTTLIRRSTFLPAYAERSTFQ